MWTLIKWGIHMYVISSIWVNVGTLGFVLLKIHWMLSRSNVDVWSHCSDLIPLLTYWAHYLFTLRSVSSSWSESHSEVGSKTHIRPLTKLQRYKGSVAAGTTHCTLHVGLGFPDHTGTFSPNHLDVWGCSIWRKLWKLLWFLKTGHFYPTNTHKSGPMSVS